jgi:hypothetical protein
MSSPTKHTPYKFLLEIDVPLVYMPEERKEDTRMLIDKKKSKNSEFYTRKQTKFGVAAFKKET